MTTYLTGNNSWSLMEHHPSHQLQGSVLGPLRSGGCNLLFYQLLNYFPTKKPERSQEVYADECVRIYHKLREIILEFRLLLELFKECFSLL